MDYSTLEIIGLAFLSGLKIAEIADEVIDEAEDENKEEDKNEDAEIKTGVIKLDREKGKKFIDYIENNLIKEDK